MNVTHARRYSILSQIASAALVACVLVVAAACQGADNSPASLARSAGCMACHGEGFAGGGPGPALVGLYGSSIVLDDGRQVAVDDAFLTQSITDPAAARQKGVAGVMPVNAALSPAQIAALVEYIKSLKK